MFWILDEGITDSINKSIRQTHTKSLVLTLHKRK